MSKPEENRIPATPLKNLLLFVILAATFFVNMKLLSDWDIIRALIVVTLMSFAMVTVMKHGVKAS
jgi:hypothetical protein